MDYPVCGGNLVDCSVSYSGDVFLNGPIKGLSTESPLIGPVRVGRVYGDNFVRNGNNNIIGKIMLTGKFTEDWLK